MSEHKGYRILTTVPYFAESSNVNRVTYHIDRRERDGWNHIREGTLYGPFKSGEDARSAAESAARGWIDQHSK